MHKVIYPENTTERHTTYVMLDLHDAENSKSYFDCRCYGFGWYGVTLGETSGEETIQCWERPKGVDILYIPLKLYLQSFIRTELPHHE